MAIRREEEETKMSFQLAPMIDVVFMLLTFFIVAGSYKQTESELQIQLPSLKPPENKEAMPASFQVDIDEAGVIKLNESVLDDSNSRELPRLILKLKDLTRNDASAPVVIAPNPKAKHQRVMDVLNACHATEVKNVSFAGGGGG
jgi:biopolymer transport protein ExbD